MDDISVEVKSQIQGHEAKEFSIATSENNTIVGMTYEPRHDTINKMSLRPAKTQISLGIRPVWSESLLCA